MRPPRHRTGDVPSLRSAAVRSAIVRLGATSFLALHRGGVGDYASSNFAGIWTTNALAGSDQILITGQGAARMME